MSTVKSKKLQVGTDASASNNFTIYQPATPDGTLRIGVGNADSPTEVARFDATGMISGGAIPDALSTASGSAPSYSARAWASFGGGTSSAGTIYGSGNVSSVTDNATGQATINFTTAMPNANYSVVGMCTGYSNYNSTLMVLGSADGSGNQQPTTKTTSAVKVHFGHSNTVVNEHVGYLTIAIFG